MLDLSLLVCTKNSSKSIIACLESSLLILKADAELILVDGCSKDNTIDLILKFLYENNISKYKIISQLKPGLYDAFNLAIEIASRKKLLFLHSDDTLKAPQNLINDINKCNQDVIFYGVVIKGKIFNRVWHLKSFNQINIGLMIIPPHAGIVVARKVYKKIGNFNTNYKISGDFDWMLRLLNSNNISFNFSNKITYIMKTGGVSDGGFCSAIKKTLEDIKIIRFHGYSMPLYRVIRKKICKLWQINFFN